MIDGTGKPAYSADIGVSNGKIVSIGTNLKEASLVIDVSGLTVTPGFIDSHSHADNKILDYPEQKEKLEQGVTTSVAGQCGGSVAPINKKLTENKKDQFTKFGRRGDICETMGSFIDILSDKPIGANLLCFVGHGTVRRAVLGDEGREATASELKQMEKYLCDAFEHGAAGLSFGLFYAPGCFATTQEAIAVAKVAKRYGKPISAHIRSESDKLIEAVQEFIEIVRCSGACGVLSHHKATQTRNWGKIDITLKMINDAVNEGLDIYCDVYPYCASSTKLSQAFVPFDWRAGGTMKLIDKLSDPFLVSQIKKDYLSKFGSNYSWIQINRYSNAPEFEGKTLDVLAELLSLDPFDAAMKLIIDSKDDCTACFFSVNEQDLMKVIGYERTMICTDSGMAGESKKFHPRMVASFPRAIGVYCRQKSVVSLEEMIRKMTSLPAFVYGIENKGCIKVGYDADICIFDANTIVDKADFVNCDQRAEGLHYVIVNGQIVATDSVYNGKMEGKFIKT